MLGPDPDRLLASRGYSALATCCFYVEDTIGAEVAIRLAVEYAGDSPTEELAWALCAQSQYLNRQGRFAVSVEAAGRAIDAARIAGCVEAELDASYIRSLALFHLGHVGDALAGLEGARVLARSAGIVGYVLDSVLPVQYMEAGQVDRGLSVAREGYEEALALGLQFQAGLCGGAALVALLWRGSFDEVEQRFEDLGELGLPASKGRGRSLRAELLMARGDADAAAPLVRETAAQTQAVRQFPFVWDVLTGSGWPRCSTTGLAPLRPRGRTWPRWRTPTPRCARPRSHGSASKPSASRARRPVSGSTNC